MRKVNSKEYCITSKLNSKRILRISNDTDSEKYFTVSSSQPYDTFIIFGQRDRTGIFDIVSTHNTSDITKLTLDSKSITYENAGTGKILMTLPAYSTVQIISGTAITAEQSDI